MACETESKQIGEHEYSVTQWPADKSLAMKLRLVATIGPAVIEIGKVTLQKGATDIDELDAFGSGLDLLFKGKDPKVISDLIKECIIGVAYDGNKITPSSFNEVFSGDGLANIYPVFFFVMRVNYANLFKGQRQQEALAKVMKLF